MSLPPIPQGPTDRYGRPVTNFAALLTVWGILVATITRTLPDLIRRLANDVDVHR